MPLNSRRLAPLVAVLLSLSAFMGCMDDPVTGPEVRPRLVLAPAKVGFYSPVASFVAPSTGDLVIKWSRSPADTQLNFKGYFVQVWQSVMPTKVDDTEMLIQPPIGTMHVRKLPGELDTSATFHGVTAGRYTARVWGEKATDTLGYSESYGRITFDFDPRPLTNPTNLRATSVGPGQIGLIWDNASTYNYTGMYETRVYYRDASVKDSFHLATAIQRGSDTFGIVHQTKITVGGLKEPLHGSSERAVQIWVKAMRNDSTFFYGDSNSIVWAGAVAYSSGTATTDTSSHHVDSTHKGFHHAIFIGQIGGGTTGAQLGVSDDTIDNNAQIGLQFNSGMVTLQAQNGAAFLDGPKIDHAISLDSIYYSAPKADPSKFNTQSIQLPATSDSSAIVYLKFKDFGWDKTNHPDEWARILIVRQADGSFINASGGIDIEVRFQPGSTFDGSSHLPYY
jgi:hypothetical protein